MSKSGPDGLGISWSALSENLLEVLKDGIVDLVEPIADDLDTDGFAMELAEIAKNAAMSGDDEALDEAKANLPWLAEYHRVRAVNEQWEAINKVIDVAKGTLSAVLTALISRYTG